MRISDWSSDVCSSDLCTSINHVVCHGIPDDKPLREGDIVNVDVTPMVDGWHGATSRMYLLGDMPIKARRLVEVTYECLLLGLEQAQLSNTMGDVAHAIQTHAERTEEHTSELQSLMRISYALFCLKTKQ